MSGAQEPASPTELQFWPRVIVVLTRNPNTKYIQLVFGVQFPPRPKIGIDDSAGPVVFMSTKRSSLTGSMTTITPSKTSTSI
jgi:hypothetical protein